VELGSNWWRFVRSAQHDCSDRIHTRCLFGAKSKYCDGNGIGASGFDDEACARMSPSGATGSGDATELGVFRSVAASSVFDCASRSVDAPSITSGSGVGSCAIA
jgi:hypothetical protein